MRWKVADKKSSTICDGHITAISTMSRLTATHHHNVGEKKNLTDFFFLLCISQIYTKSTHKQDKPQIDETKYKNKKKFAIFFLNKENSIKFVDCCYKIFA